MPGNSACSEGGICPRFGFAVACFLLLPGLIILRSFVRLQGEDLLSSKQRDPVTGERTGWAFSFVWWETARDIVDITIEKGLEWRVTSYLFL
jgi:hypothetical protein